MGLSRACGEWGSRHSSAPVGSAAPGVSSTLTWTPGAPNGPTYWAVVLTWEKDFPWKDCLWVIGVLGARPSWVGGGLGLRQDKAWRPEDRLCLGPSSACLRPRVLGGGGAGGDKLYPRAPFHFLLPQL